MSPQTHEVTNQVPPRTGHDTAEDPALLEGLRREGAGWAEDEVHELGRLAGTEHAQDLGRLAEKHPPVLRTHDRYGHRVDEVDYDPAYHELMRTAVSHGLHGAPWADDRPGAHVARAAKFMVWNVDAGHGCPISMTYAVVPALRANRELSAELEPLLTNRVYDPVLRRPVGQAGSDRRDVDDREAGRLRRPCQHHQGRAGLRRLPHADRAQVVHLGADVRRLPHPGSGARRTVLLPGAARPVPTALATRWR